MVKKLIDTNKLTAIADAIRERTDSANTYSVDGMVDAIVNIPSGGGGGDTSIEDGLIERTLTEYSNDRVTKIGNYAFRDCRSLTTVDFPVATSVGNYAFHGCSLLTTVDLPTAASVGNYAFQSCTSLTTVDLPTAASVATDTFFGCSSLTTVSLPVATSIGAGGFQNCLSLTIVDFPLATSVGTNAFRWCYSLTTLILRNTTKVCTLLSTSAFKDCYHYHGTVNSEYNPDGLQDGYIYVPASLIEDYKTATNWSTFATQFRALEDYTVDGTTTGDLDESKI